MNAPDAELKKRYLDSVAELERKEERWQTVEATLRKCISRLSFVGDGIDPRLDDQLEQLRNRVRREPDLKALLRLIESISKRAETLVSERRNNPNQQAPGSELLALLEQAAFPGDLQKRAAKVADLLKQDPLQPQSVAEAKRVVMDALAQASTAQTSNRSGLLGKLFSHEQTPGTEGEPATFPKSNDSDTADQAKLLLEELIDQLRRRIEGLEALAEQARVASGRQELQEVVKALVAVIPRQTQAPTAGQKPHSEIAPLEQEEPDASPTAEHLLLQLIERLDLPTELFSRAQALKGRLSKGVAEREWSGVLGELVLLLEHARDQAERERQEVERFLMQMTEQLQVLDQEVDGIGELGREMQSGNQRMDRDMQGHVNDLQHTVNQANDLNDLKSSIQQRLQLIQGRLRDHREETEKLVHGFEQRIDLLTTKLGDMQQETDDLRQSVEKARSEAFTDALTGLQNRLAFDTRLAEEYARWDRYQHPLSIIVVDVDHFKKVNDTYGHLAGDKVLQVIGGQLKKGTRSTDHAARYGGEEFVVLLPEADLREAKGVAEKIRHAIEEKPFHSGKNRVNITVSCGVASFKKGDGRKQPFERADEALYLAKRRGRNRVCTEEQVPPGP